MREALIIGGSNGIGLALAKNLEGYSTIYILDKQSPEENFGPQYRFIEFNLLNGDYSILNSFKNIDTLIITAGFGKLSLFNELEEDHIINSFQVNTIGVIRIIKHFYSKISGNDNFYCAIMGSISGMLSSPFFSIYGATKAALCKFIESINIELIKSGTSNQILNVSPGSIKGTKFYNGENNIDIITPLALDILKRMYNKEDLFIPEYENIYKDVLKRYHEDFRKFGIESYDYKIKSRR